MPLDEKKLDMSLDDIIRRSSTRTGKQLGIGRGRQHRRGTFNKGQGESYRYDRESKFQYTGRPKRPMTRGSLSAGLSTNNGGGSASRIIAGTRGRISGVRGRISGVRGRLGGVRGRLGGVRGRLGGARGRIRGTTPVRIAGVRGRVTAVRGGITGVLRRTRGVRGTGTIMGTSTRGRVRDMKERLGVARSYGTVRGRGIARLLSRRGSDFERIGRMRSDDILKKSRGVLVSASGARGASRTAGWVSRSTTSTAKELTVSINNSSRGKRRRGAVGISPLNRATRSRQPVDTGRQPMDTGMSLVVNNSETPSPVPEPATFRIQAMQSLQPPGLNSSIQEQIRKLQQGVRQSIDTSSVSVSAQTTVQSLHNRFSAQLAARGEAEQQTTGGRNIIIG